MDASHRALRLPQFRSEFARELRAHAVFGPVVVALAPLFTCALAARAVPRVDALVAIAGSASALVLASQCLACELRDEGQNSIDVLRRAPGGLGLAVFAKLAVVLLGTLLSCGAVLALAPILGVPGATSAWLGSAMLGSCALGGVGLAASTWVPKASLALPTALLVGLLLALPAGLAWLENPWMRPSAAGARFALGVALPFAALASVWATCKLLGRIRSELVTGLGGAGVFVLAAAPFLMTQALSSEDRVRTSSLDFTIDRAFLSPSAHTLWLTCRNREKSAGNYLLRVDLATRVVTELPRRDQRFELPSAPDARVGRSAQIRLRTLAENSSDGVILDADTAAEVVEARSNSTQFELGSVAGERWILEDGELYAMTSDAGGARCRRVFPFAQEADKSGGAR